MSVQPTREPPGAVRWLALYVRYAPWLRGRIISKYGRSDADDILQETWLRISPYEAGGNIRHPKALLLRIASNLAADRFERRTRRQRLTEEMSGQVGWAVEQPAQTDALVAKQLILGLPQPLRDVFVLSRVGGLTNSQIAEQLGISLKTVEKRMTKALAHCAAQLRL